MVFEIDLMHGNKSQLSFGAVRVRIRRSCNNIITPERPFLAEKVTKPKVAETRSGLRARTGRGSKFLTGKRYVAHGDGD